MIPLIDLGYNFERHKTSGALILSMRLLVRQEQSTSIGSIHRATAELVIETIEAAREAAFEVKRGYIPIPSS
jgi:hypothetical protein